MLSPLAHDQTIGRSIMTRARLTALLSLLVRACLFARAAAVNTPVAISFYPISPVPGHIYAPNATVPVMIGINNADAALAYSAIVELEISGNSTSPAAIDKILLLGSLDSLDS